MLVLSRRANEAILFPGINAAVRVVSIIAGSVRLGVEAPPQVRVLRAELRGKPAAQGQDCPGVTPNRPGLGHLLDVRLRVASRGLALLRQQVEAGQGPDAVQTLAEIEDELRLLRQRLQAEAGQIPPGRPAQPPTATALVVEDNANERELLATVLRMSGLQVDTAGDGADALTYLRSRGRPDVVLLDMGLPRCDGPTALRAIRRDPAWAGLKVYGVSGHAPAEFGLEVGPGGVDRWFQKPVDPGRLVEQLAGELAPGP
jgi:carbon storage regulator CsrA